MPEPLPLLINGAAARTSRRRNDALVRALRMAGREARLHDTPGAAQVRPWVAEQIAAGTERLAVVGGDGIVHLVAQAAAGSALVVGVVPSGTGNDFARALQIGTDPASAVATALLDPVAIDALAVRGEVAGEAVPEATIVASVLTLGFSADVNARANALRHPRGSHRYTVATLLELRRLRARPLTLTFDGGEPLDVDASILAVANTACFGGGMRIAPDADPTDGRLDVCVIGKVGRFELLRVFPRVFKGTHVQHRAVTMHRATRVTIASRDTHPVDLWGDGEYIGCLPVTVEVRPGALRIAGARPQTTAK